MAAVAETPARVAVRLPLVPRPAVEGLPPQGITVVEVARPRPPPVVVEQAQVVAGVEPPPPN